MTNEFEFVSHIGMCGCNGITFAKESYSILLDDEDEEYWVFDSDNPEFYTKSLWIHYTGYKAIAVFGGGREQELECLALKALNAAVRGDWTEAKAIVSAWDNNA